MWPYNPFEFSPLVHQHFRSVLEPGGFLSARDFHNLRYPGYVRPWRSVLSHRNAESSLRFPGDKFEVNLDVQQFKPDEITVRVSDNFVVVEGKHEEREDEHGFISRHFVRKSLLSRGYDVDKIESRLSSDGVLTITATKSSQNQEQRNIPIIQTGQPSTAVEHKSEEPTEE